MVRDTLHVNVNTGLKFIWDSFFIDSTIEICNVQWHLAFLSMLSSDLEQSRTHAFCRPYIMFLLVLKCFTKKNLCGGGVEYLHLDPASRRRRRKGKSHIWDSKIWSRFPKDSNPRRIVLARASSICKRQTRPLVREDAPQNQDRNCQTVINIWSWAQMWARHQDLLTDWPSVAMWLWLRSASKIALLIHRFIYIASMPSFT
jgi:hypothetical protein